MRRAPPGNFVPFGARISSRPPFLPRDGNKGGFDELRASKGTLFLSVIIVTAHGDVGRGRFGTAIFDEVAAI
jgi:hypothetical protein